MIKKLFLPALLLVFVSTLTGCSQYTLVNSETYNGADLASYKTFRIVTPDDNNQLPPTMTYVTYYNIAAAVREQMVERGYVESPDGALLINLGLTVHKEIATEPLSMAMPQPPVAPPYFGPYYRGMGPWFIYPRVNYMPGYYSNARVITGIYKEGVLTMDIVNMQQKLPLFSSSVATILQDGDAQFRNLQGIAQAVDVLFSKFPVPLLPQYRK